MGVNRGKQFEHVVQQSFSSIKGVSVDRLHDQTTGYAGSSNIADFIVYKYPHQYYIECKTIHGNTLSIHRPQPSNKYGNITNKQWEGMLAKSKIEGVIAGVLCWWVDKDITRFIPIQSLQKLREYEYKSIRYDADVIQGERMYEVKARKKRVLFDYDMQDLFQRISGGQNEIQSVRK